MSGFTFAYDVTHDNLPSAPQGVQLFGYATGSGGIAWTAEDWAAHPGAGRIDQDPAASDYTADVLDVEGGAVPVGSPEMAAWAQKAMADFAAATRPGQREPAIYMSEANVTAVVNALVAGGVTSGVSLWVADWSWSQAQAIQDVLTAAGPFPVVGVQFRDPGPYDMDVFSTAWLSRVSGAPPAGGNYHLSVTPHREVNAAWDEVPGADHYVITFTPAGSANGTTVREAQPSAGSVHLGGFTVDDVPGTLIVNAIVHSKAVLVGTWQL